MEVKLKGKQLRQLRETKLQSLKEALKEGKPVNVATIFFCFFTHAQRNLTQLDYFWARTESRKLKTWCKKAHQIQMKFREP